MLVADPRIADDFLGWRLVTVIHCSPFSVATSVVGVVGMLVGVTVVVFFSIVVVGLELEVSGVASVVIILSVIIFFLSVGVCWLESSILAGWPRRCRLVGRVGRFACVDIFSFARIAVVRFSRCAAAVREGRLAGVDFVLEAGVVTASL